jgi:hypothetical protein
MTLVFGIGVETVKQSGKTAALCPGTTQNLVPAVMLYEPTNLAFTPVIVSAVKVAKVVFGAEFPLFAMIK